MEQLTPTPGAPQATRDDAAERLQRLIRRKRSERSRLAKDIESIQQELVELIGRQARLQSLDEHIHGYFAKAVAKPGLSRRQRNAVQEVYDSLQMDGAISPAPELRTDDDECPCPVCTAEREARSAEDEPIGAEGAHETYGGRAGTTGSDPSLREVASAAKPEHDARLKKLYRDLALHAHPDRADDDEHRARNEALMREVNEAYHGGDTDRLIELSRELGLDVSDLQGARGVLNELIQQYEAIKLEVRAMRYSMPGQIVVDTRRAEREGFPTPVEAMEMSLDAQEKVLVAIRDHVRAFVDGSMSTKTFLRGPDLGGDDDLDDLEALLGAMLGMAAEFDDDITVPRSTRRRSRGGRGRKRK